MQFVPTVLAADPSETLRGPRRATPTPPRPARRPRRRLGAGATLAALLVLGVLAVL